MEVKLISKNKQKIDDTKSPTRRTRVSLPATMIATRRKVDDDDAYESRMRNYNQLVDKQLDKRNRTPSQDMDYMRKSQERRSQGLYYETKRASVEKNGLNADLTELPLKPSRSRAKI